MKEWKLQENLVRFRREHKVTQEEVADFVGVTKASVSKWENGLSMPDILLLPQLAAFFNVTVDELIGYEAQLSPEQIRRIYEELCSDFARLPFQEAWERTQTLTHRYYSCYPFLLQVCVLYINHFMLEPRAEVRMQILAEGETICGRIQKYCRDVNLCRDAMTLQAVFRMQAGNPGGAMELLEGLADPCRLSEQNDVLLVQAYQMAGESEKASDYTQIRMYLHLMNLISLGMQYLSATDQKQCEETIRRMKGIMELYQLEKLHPNLAAQFYYQTAAVYASNHETELAVKELAGFERCVCSILKEKEFRLQGDAYFDRLDTWIERLPLGAKPPRDIGFAGKSALEALSHPLFADLKDNREFQNICRRILEGGKER